MPAVYDGGLAYRTQYAAGLTPDQPLWIDVWSNEYMRIPPENGAEPGKYSSDRTPYAEEVMKCLSPEHPCRRVVAKVASQLMKTQVALNWICGSIHQAPGNMLVLLPSLSLAKRVSGRIDKTINAVPVVNACVAAPRSRDSRNTIDTKEFKGGTLYITTAGSAANLAEIPARYIYGDEVDRWELNVDKEGDPIELAEARTSTFGRNAKIYYTSSPTLEGSSRIDDLYTVSDQRHYYVPCPHCEHLQELVWENLRYDDDYRYAYYKCAECDCVIEEHHKTAMLAAGKWIASAPGDGKTVGFHLSTLYAPAGWTSWAELGKQYDTAKVALDRGDPEPMQVFYNTRLAKCWDMAQERAHADDLKKRAEKYSLRSVPDGVLVITAAVDVQGNRLELKLVGWGVGLESWVLDYVVISGDPAEKATWDKLEEILQTPLVRSSGREMKIEATCIDAGDGNSSEEVYTFTRPKRYRNVIAIKGASRPNKPVIATRPTKLDVSKRGKTMQRGAELWIVGTDTAKDWIYNRIKFDSGPGAIHFSEDLSADYYEQMTAERKLTRYVKGFKRTEWVKAKAARNEAWDLMVYNLAAAHFLGLHRWREADWERKKLRVDPDQQDIFAPQVPQIVRDDDQEEEQPAKPQTRPRESPKVSAPKSIPTQQNPGQESGFVVYHSTDYD
ncbi:phage terminase large subunit family protein [Undibacterium sp. Di26W]|uniref:phage terminase large subunit family protein n=1 Tax=Undibacterium sp. Di26W TaxID=3413035 RepID=UPI003BEF6611